MRVLVIGTGGREHALALALSRDPEVTEVHAACDDFHWLRGQDRVLPLETAEGAPAGLLVVRRYGFDLAGVPDGRSQREAALRSSLGNLVRRAERAFAASDGRLDALSGVLPRFPVTGPR